MSPKSKVQSPKSVDSSLAPPKLLRGYGVPPSGGSGQIKVRPAGFSAAARLKAELHTPFLFLNLAMTADGKIATANRRYSSFSSARDKENMMELRATADAVMSGARTVDLNPVTLGPGGEKYRALRKKRGLSEYNIRVIVSGSGSIDPKAEIFKKRFSPIVILTTNAAGPRRLARMRKLADDVIVSGDKHLDFHAALSELRAKWKVKRLLCEGGGELDDALFRAGVVNELHLTICPKIFGGQHAPTICDGKGFPNLASACRMKLKSMNRRGDELFLVFRAVPQSEVPPGTKENSPPFRTVGRNRK